MTTKTKSTSDKKKSAARRRARKFSLLERSLIILAVSAAIGLLVSVIVFAAKPSSTCSAATLQFTFEGSADGTAPSGVRFNLSDISTDAVLTEALKKAGLEGRVSADDVRSNLVVSGSYPRDMIAQTMSYESLLNLTANRELTIDSYFPTMYRVALYDRFSSKLSKKELNNLLTNILEVYSQTFAQRYGHGPASNDIVFDLDSYDYPQQVEILTQKTEDAVRYAEALYDMDPTFTYNGVGFGDIAVRLQSLINSDVSRLNATLTLNALTKNPERLQTQYSFEIRDLSTQLELRRKLLLQIDALVESYQKNEIIYISNGDALTKIDGNSSATYDYLVNRRKETADLNTQINARIAKYRLRLDDILKGMEPDKKTTDTTDTTESGDSTTEGNDGEDGTTTQGETSTAPVAQSSKAAKDAEEMKRLREALEANISALSAKRESLMQDLSEMIKAWNGTQINDDTLSVSKCSISGRSIFSGAFISETIRVGGPFVVIGFLVMVVMIIRVRRREEKKAAAC